MENPVNTGVQTPTPSGSVPTPVPTPEVQNPLLGNEAAASNTLDDLYARITAQTGGETQTTPEATADAPVVDEAVAAAEAELNQEEQDAHQEAGAEEQSPEDPLDKIDETKPESLKQIWRDKRVYSSYKWAKEVAKALSGMEITKLDPALLPSVDELKSMQASHNQLQELLVHYSTPSMQEQFIDTLYQQNPEAMRALASNLSQYAAKKDASLYGAVAAGPVNTFIGGMYRQAQTHPNQEIREFLLNTARAAEWWMTGGPNGGRTRDVPGMQQEAAPDDALSGERARLNAERASLQRERNQIQQAIQQRQMEEVRVFSDGLRQELDGAISSVAAEVLKPIEAAYKNNPKVLDALKDKVIVDIGEALQKHNKWGLFQLNHRKAVEVRDAGAKVTLAGELKLMARQAAETIRPQYINNETTKTVVAQNQARHDQLRQASTPVTPSNGGAAPQRSVAPDLRKINNFDDRYAALMGRAVSKF